jgi:hypothetical protein
MLINCRQKVLLKNIKPKKKSESAATMEKERQKDYSSSSEDSSAVGRHRPEMLQALGKEKMLTSQVQIGSLLGLAYENSDDERN